MPRTTKHKPRIVFVTGTDTGVGKTVLTALLLSHLHQTGSRALAIKPFCSGARADAELLHALQDGDITLDEINPFHFPEPLAPLVAARKGNQQISLKAALAQIPSVISHLLSPQFKVQSSKFKVQGSTSPSPQNTRPSTLLIEGAGGLLTPLGEGFSVLDLILAIQHPPSAIRVIVVAPNRLGTINHTLLTTHALQSRNFRRPKVVVMDVLPPQHSTPDTRSNPSILAELLFPIPLFHIPNLGKNPGKPEQIHRFAKKLKKTLAEILA